MTRKRIITAACGAVLVAGSVVWSTAAVPQLLKFPLSTNMTLQYSGNFVTYVDPHTGATLSKPTSVPLVVDRTITAVPASSDSSVAIVNEHLVLHFSGSAITENNVYALNRRKMCNVPNMRACTFAPGNPYPAAGSYYVTLPMNFRPGVTKINIWKPETGTTYPLVALTGSSQPSNLDGLHVAWLSGGIPMTPVASYERTSLEARGLPMTMAPSAVEAELAVAGVSVPALTKVLLPVLTKGELKEVLAVLGSRIALHYYAFGSGLVGGETRTGAILDVKNVIDGIAVAPDMSGLHTLATVLSNHSTVSGVPAALVQLDKLAAAPPQPVYELQYSQTPASVTAVVRTANSELRQMAIVKYWVPGALSVLGGLLLLLSAYGYLRKRHDPSAAAVVRPAGEATDSGLASSSRAA